MARNCATIVGLASAQQAKTPSALGAAPAANAPKANAGAPESAPAQEGGSPAAEPGKIPDVAMPGPVGSHGNKADAAEGSGASALRVSAAVAGGVAVAGFFY